MVKMKVKSEWEGMKACEMVKKQRNRRRKKAGLDERKKEEAMGKNEKVGC
jgi:hypothetical protein